MKSVNSVEELLHEMVRSSGFPIAIFGVVFDSATAVLCKRADLAARLLVSMLLRVCALAFAVQLHG